ncbi:hypothetical protein [Bacillus sp. USDA818B3_A]|uniref:hypothetical protein n=1 Tax=Bacillus sp. USDA818B3_A TaxID=2698834 RepID=UPI001371F3B8|nr:hypothetical protein [Bacillus sp. USDA818B3_A]
MTFYEKLPNDLLIAFYNEVNKNIHNGVSTKKMYYELGIIYSIMSQRGIMNQSCKEEANDVQTMENYSA